MTKPAYHKIRSEAIRRLILAYSEEYENILKQVKKEFGWEPEKLKESKNIAYVAQREIKLTYPQRYQEILKEEKEKCTSQTSYQTPYNRAMSRLVGEHYNEFREIYKSYSVVKKIEG